MADQPHSQITELASDRRPLSILTKAWVFGLSFWPLQIGGWAFFSLLPLGVWLTHVFPDPMMRLVFLIRPVTGFAITCALRPLCGWIFSKKWNLGVLFLFSLLASVIIGSVELLGTLWIASLLGVNWDGPQTHGLVSAMFLMRSGLLFLWFVLYFSLKNLRQVVELEARTRKAELQLLYAQVNPHFLFNALTTIMEVGKENAQVVALTQSLCSYLRFALIQGQGQGENLHPLREELDALRGYLEVEKARFQENLEYRIEVEDAAARFSVPSALIQPLLENAIKYGQRTSPRPLRVKIAASLSTQGPEKEGALLHLTVSNTGSWIDPRDSTSLGSGISNLRNRLHLIYGEAASLRPDPVEGMVSVHVTLPIKP